MVLTLIYFIVGLSVGVFIGYKLIESNVIYHGPDSNEVKRIIFYCNENDKYYKFIPTPYICPPIYARSIKNILQKS